MHERFLTHQETARQDIFEESDHVRTLLVKESAGNSSRTFGAQCRVSLKFDHISKLHESVLHGFPEVSA